MILFVILIAWCSATGTVIQDSAFKAVINEFDPPSNAKAPELATSAVKFFSQLKRVFGGVNSLSEFILELHGFDMQNVGLISKKKPGNLPEVDAWLVGNGGVRMAKLLVTILSEPMMPVWCYLELNESTHVPFLLLLWWMGKVSVRDVRRFFVKHQVGTFARAIFEHFDQNDRAGCSDADDLDKDMWLLSLGVHFPHALTLGAPHLATHWLLSPNTQSIVKLDLHNLHGKSEWEITHVIGPVGDLSPKALLNLQADRVFPNSSVILAYFKERLPEFPHLNPSFVLAMYRTHEQFRYGRGVDGGALFNEINQCSDVQASRVMRDLFTLGSFPSCTRARIGLLFNGDVNFICQSVCPTQCQGKSEAEKYGALMNQILKNGKITLSHSAASALSELIIEASKSKEDAVAVIPKIMTILKI